jgi:hypothetical protein
MYSIVWPPKFLPLIGSLKRNRRAPSASVGGSILTILKQREVLFFSSGGRLSCLPRTGGRM